MTRCASNLLVQVAIANVERNQGEFDAPLLFKLAVPARPTRLLTLEPVLHQRIGFVNHFDRRGMT